LKTNFAPSSFALFFPHGPCAAVRRLTRPVPFRECQGSWVYRRLYQHPPLNVLWGPSAFTGCDVNHAFFFFPSEVDSETPSPPADASFLSFFRLSLLRILIRWRVCQYGRERPPPRPPCLSWNTNSAICTPFPFNPFFLIMSLFLFSKRSTLFRLQRHFCF